MLRGKALFQTRVFWFLVNVLLVACGRMIYKATVLGTVCGVGVGPACIRISAV